MRACWVCGEPASFGFNVRLRFKREGLWSCFAHRGETERHLVQPAAPAAPVDEPAPEPVRDPAPKQLTFL